MREHYRSFVKSVSYALSGIRQAVKYEIHMRFHLACAFAAAAAGFGLGLNPNEWLTLILTITLVLFAELMNTALEANVDLVTKEKKPEAKIAKDVAAGAVLISSLNAVIIGIILFGPKLAGLLSKNVG